MLPLFALCCLFALAGCASTLTPSPGDAAPDAPLDAARDGSSEAAVDRVDATETTDVSDAPDVLDAPTRLPCDAIIDLNARATPRADGALSYVADGPATAERTPWTLPYCFRGFRYPLAYVTAFRYTARRAGEVTFSVLDANPSQPVALAAMVLDACASDRVALECSLAPSPAWAGVRRDLSALRPLREGESVVLLVGSVFPQPPQVSAFGRFEVRVTELPDHADGERCGPRVAACREGLACNYSESGICRAAGAFGQPCRRDRTCDEGLACGGAGVCLRGLRAGDRCDISGSTGACPPGAACESNLTEYVCIPNGARWGYCRDDDACDDGLSCDGLHCRPTVAEGASCGGDESCARGTHCVTVGPMTARCVRDGARGGRCVGPEFACDAGLACADRDGFDPRCLPAAALGAACDSLRQTSACREGTCVRGVCAPDGSRDAACRATATPCEAGLGCVGVPARCTAVVAVGAPCPRGSCPAGSWCGDEDPVSGAHCLADGVRAGRCRLNAPVCNAGLACSSGDSERSGRCLPAIARGEACDVTGVRNACTEGLACNSSGRCGPVGSAGAPCREREPFCDGGAACVGQGPEYPGRCVAPIAAGGTCMVLGPPCAPGTSCVTREFVAPYTCEPFGTVRGTRCRDASPMCDAGLACGVFERTCLPEVALGERCDALERTNRCVPGASCLGAPMRFDGMCVRDGLSGSRCRTTEPLCDVGLSCDGPPLAVASRCR